MASVSSLLNQSIDLANSQTKIRQQNEMQRNSQSNRFRCFFSSCFYESVCSRILELLSHVLQLHSLRLQCQTRGHGTCPTTGKTHQLQAPQAHFCVFFRRQFCRRHGVVTLSVLTKWDGMDHMRWMRLERFHLERVRQLICELPDCYSCVEGGGRDLAMNWDAQHH
jgi:hypothetical protein